MLIVSYFASASQTVPDTTTTTATTISATTITENTQDVTTETTVTTEDPAGKVLTRKRRFAWVFD